MPLESAIVPRQCRSAFVVLCALSNAILEPRFFRDAGHAGERPANFTVTPFAVQPRETERRFDEEETLRGLLGAASAQDRQAA